MHRRHQGFTLVELSIVLVIIGLLVGGVLSGQSLIHAAELRAVSTEYGKYSTAVKAFRDKYLAVPGDMKNATQFWGRLNTNADCATNSGAAVSAAGACDGDGDGVVPWGSNAGTNVSREVHQFWRQLALAGLIEGTYSGLSGTGGMDVVPGTNSPKSKLSNAGWGTAATDYSIETAGFVLSGGYGNTLVFGSYQPNDVPQAPALKPEDAWNLDTKMDDGKPSTGFIISMYGNGTNCTTAASNADYTAAYKLTNTALACPLYFTNQY